MMDNDFLIVFFFLHSYIDFAACLDPPLGYVQSRIIKRYLD